MKTLNLLTLILMIVGALNWGLVALAGFDLVAFIFGMSFGQTSLLSRIVYGLVGISALFQIGMVTQSIRHHESAAHHAAA